jgi:hypothetical protein
MSCFWRCRNSPKGRKVSAGYGFVYEVQFVGEVMIAGFGILFFAGHRALLVAVNEWRSDFVLQKDGEELDASWRRRSCLNSATTSSSSNLFKPD